MCSWTVSILAVRQFNHRHTGENLAQKLLEILDEFDIKEKCWYFVSDSAKNMEKRKYKFIVRKLLILSLKIYI